MKNTLTFITKSRCYNRLIKYKFHEPLSTPIKIKLLSRVIIETICFIFVCLLVYASKIKKSRWNFQAIQNSPPTNSKRKLGRCCKFSSLNHDYVWFMWTNLYFVGKIVFHFVKQSKALAVRLSVWLAEFR